MSFVQALLQGHTVAESVFASDPQFTTGAPKTVTLGNYIYPYLVARYYQPPEWRTLTDNLGNTYTLAIDQTNGQLEQRLWVAEVTHPGTLTRFVTRTRTALPAVAGFHGSLCAAEFTDPPSFLPAVIFDSAFGSLSKVDHDVPVTGARDGFSLYGIGMWRHPASQGSTGADGFTPPSGYTVAAEHKYVGDDVSHSFFSNAIEHGAPSVALAYRYGPQSAGVLHSEWDHPVYGVIGFTNATGVADVYVPQVYRVKRP